MNKKEYRILQPVDRTAIAWSSVSLSHDRYALRIEVAEVLASGGLGPCQFLSCSVTNLSNDKKLDGLLILNLTMIETGEKLHGVITKEVIEGGYGLLSASWPDENGDGQDGESETLFFNNFRRAYRLIVKPESRKHRS